LFVVIEIAAFPMLQLAVLVYVGGVMLLQSVFGG
jgi:hypothetical protein